MSRWGFVVSAARNRLSGQKAVYAARVRHMDVLRGNTLYREISNYLAINPTLAENLVNGIGGFIESKLLQGYKLDFGVFKCGLSLRGGFDSANDVFKPKRNSVCVSFSSGTRLKKSVSALCPENVTDVTDPIIHSVYGAREGSQKSQIVCREVCGANGKFPTVAFRGDGDGVWLETAGGMRIADARVLSASATRIDFIFETDIPVGRYRLVIGFHEGSDASIVTAEISVATRSGGPFLVDGKARSSRRRGALAASKKDDTFHF